jgi:hypothetical protein
MTRPGRSRTIALAAGALLFAALLVFHLRYSHAAAWRVPAAQRPFVDRAVTAAAADSGRTEQEIRRTTRPFVHRHMDQVCVMLRSSWVWGDGSGEVCADARDGRLVSRRLSGPTFGSPSLWHRFKDRFWAMVW